MVYDYSLTIEGIGDINELRHWMNMHPATGVRWYDMFEYGCWHDDAIYFAAYNPTNWTNRTEDMKRMTEAFPNAVFTLRIEAYTNTIDIVEEEYKLGNINRRVLMFNWGEWEKVNEK